jgi:hypothetical protein
MIQFTTTILKFKSKGEKTGWTYIEVSADVAQQLKPGNKKSFRVKGRLDNFPFKGIALLPMGDESFIMPLNLAIRKGIGKRHGAMLDVMLEEDKAPIIINADLIECLSEEPDALLQFQKLPKSHQNYFSRWIESAKTDETKAKRIALAVNAMLKKKDFGTMLREAKQR